MKKPQKPSKPQEMGSLQLRSGAQTKEPTDWRAEMLARIRKLINEADPEAIEEVKWRKPSNPTGGSGVVAWGNRLHG
jgi:hypothetical protein